MTEITQLTELAYEGSVLPLTTTPTLGGPAADIADTVHPDPTGWPTALSG